MTGILQAILSFFGVTPAAAANYIEDVFSTYLYTGNGSTQTITNNIDLSTKGGLVWIKQRNTSRAHIAVDSVRGVSKGIYVNGTGGEFTLSPPYSFNSTGFSLPDGATLYNELNGTYASWTFREQAKFFDVVTYTGNGTYPRNISHNLGSTPGCIIVKKLSSTSDWFVYHRSLSVDGTFGPYRILLNTTAAQSVNDDWKNAPTSTQFTVNNSDTNGNGVTYVAYLFAHDAGGFGASGSDNVISCGSFTTNTAETVTVNLGYEPQFVIVKRSDAVGDWYVLDTMRGWDNSSSDAILYPNYSNAEGSAQRGEPNATGFRFTEGAVARTYIYIAIRRGPMKTPTSGTSVFGLSARSGTGANATVTGSAGVSDAVLIKNRGSAVGDLFAARLTGTGYLETSSTAAEVAAGTTILQANPWDVMDGVKVGTTSTITNATSNTYINYLFDRAPGFFDVVCYSGNSVNGRTVTHNLGVTPQLIIVKARTIVVGWSVYAEPAGNTLYAPLNEAVRFTSGINCWNNTSPTASVFSLSNNAQVNRTGDTYVAYLFATCTGVSKVGSYTGTGALQTVDCGFSAGARFVLIHRIDVNEDWYVWDSARGITSGNDPYLLLNSTAAEVTTTNYVDTDSTGFKVTAAAPAGLNASGGSYLFLAIA